MQTGRLSGLLQNHTKLHTDQCVDAKGKVTSHLPTYFPIYSCIEKSTTGTSSSGLDHGPCFMWGCLLTAILTLLTTATFIAFLMLCRSHIIVDGSRTTKLIFFFSFVSCGLFLIQQILDADPHIAAVGELSQGSVSICVAFVLASLLCRIHEKPKMIVHTVMPLFAILVVANVIVFTCGSLGAFTSEKNHVLDCHDPTWIMFNILDCTLCTFSLFAAYGITMKMRSMRISDNYRRRKTQQIWIVAIIYSVSTYVTLIYSITRYTNSFKNGNTCDHWMSAALKGTTISKALPKLAFAVLMYGFDTFVPLWAVVILIRHLFPADKYSHRSSSWSGEEYIGRPGALSRLSDLLDDDSIVGEITVDSGNVGRKISKRDLVSGYPDGGYVGLNASGIQG